ncbi:GntR family transcriptional regulator [Gorillibacterium sp. sgz5001074]|uniref:GntR family transcriptional regulator n=1 Tax=Gorillibacterium sp. sgz5001074 TaxID=3446695 RepID=UPI003F676CAA
MKEKATPKYMQVKQEILSWIQAGSLKTGDLMLSENEVAERFGVSRQTVRQAFGELEGEGWLKRMQGKGTFVSAPEPGGSGAPAKTVGIITTYISDYIFPHIVRGAEAALRSKGYRLLLSSTDNDKERERESLEMMLNQPLDGLIIEPTRSAEGNPNLSYYLSLEYRGIPYVMINERYPELDAPCLKSDDLKGGYLAAKHLLELGHERIAGFFKMDDLQGVNRLKGFMQAHRESGVPIQPELVVHYVTEEKRAKPLEAALRMLGQDEADRPTAFVCYNDELAVQMLEAVRQAGLSVPDGISIVGFDDSSLATATETKLTTLTHPKTDMGRDAVELLLAMIEGKRRKPVGKLYEPELVVRTSTKKT